jgi:hypothetical protein
MADSWEEHEEKIGTSSGSTLNPGASSFSFNPIAGSFIPQGTQNTAPLEKTSAERENLITDVQLTNGCKDKSTMEHKDQNIGTITGESAST